MRRGVIHEIREMQIMNIGQYAHGRGYVDFERLYRIDLCIAFFVTRAKDNFKCRRIYSGKTDKSKGIRCVQTIVLTGFYAVQEYPGQMRGIKFYDAEQTGLLFSSRITLRLKPAILLCCTGIVGRSNYSSNE